MPWYKILNVNALGIPIEVCLIDSGEYVIRTNTTTTQFKLNTSLFMNDPNTFDYIDASLEDEDVDLIEQIYRFEVRAQDIGASGVQNKYKYDEDLRYASFLMGLMRDDIFQAIKFQNRTGEKNVFKKEDDDDDLNETLGIERQFDIEITSVLFDEDDNPLLGPAQIQITCTQLQPNNIVDNFYTKPGSGYDDSQFLINTRTDQLSNWTGDGAAMTNWATFPGVADPDAAIQVFINVLDTYTYQLGIANATVYNPAAPAFGFAAGDGPTILCTTGVTREDSTGDNEYQIKKFEAFEKLRFFPLHPVMSALPTSIIQTDPNIIRLRCCGSEYPDRPQYNPWDKLTPIKKNNYEINIFNMVGDQPYLTPQNIAAPSGTNWTVDNPRGSKCMMMIKTSKLDFSQITTTPPVTGSTNQFLINDFAPNNGGSIYNSNLPIIMFAQIATPVGDTEVNFPLGSNPTVQAFLQSFVVEIQNLPLSGFLGKGFDDGNVQSLKGMGSRLPIVGVVPAKEFIEDSTDPIIHYFYQTSYYQPTQIRLPTEQSLYSLDFNLRDIVSGELLRDLIHSTEVIIRIYDLGDNPTNIMNH